MLQKDSRARAGEMIQLLKYLLLMHKVLSVDSQLLHLFIYCCVNVHLTYVYSVYRHVFGWALCLCTQEARGRSLALPPLSPEDRTVQGI